MVSFQLKLIFLLHLSLSLSISLTRFRPKPTLINAIHYCPILKIKKKLRPQSHKRRVSCSIQSLVIDHNRDLLKLLTFVLMNGSSFNQMG